jgi:Tat protein secretion system quality control protein TatD with DNase activity
MSPAFACSDCQRAEHNEAQYSRFHTKHEGINFSQSNLSAWFLLVNGLLLFIGQCLGVESLADLHALVVGQMLYSTHPDFSEEELVFLREYDRQAGLEPLQDLTGYQNSPPARLSCCLHYHVLGKLILRLDSATRQKIMYLSSYCLPDGSSPPAGHPMLKMVLIDSHTHLDELFGRHGHTYHSLEQLSDPRRRLKYVVANYVFPSKWQIIRHHLEMDPRIRITLGVHPHLIHKHTYPGYFRDLAARIEGTDRVVGVGEVGLDFTTSCRCNTAHDTEACVRGKVGAQRKFLRQCLSLANSLGKPIVIHCRDKGSGSAAQEVLLMLKEMNLTHLPIQRHCFIGNADEYVQWSTSLPNCLFSLSLRSLQDPFTREALVRHAEPRRLLLETDAPYLAKDPTEVFRVAQEASRTLTIPLAELVGICNSNASKFFKLA